MDATGLDAIGQIRPAPRDAHGGDMASWFRKSFFVMAILLASPASAQPSQPDELPAAIAAAVKSLKPQQGKVALPEAKATLDLGAAYDFYGPTDARAILVNVWGNPPENADGVLGLVMPAGKSPLTDAWVR